MNDSHNAPNNKAQHDNAVLSCPNGEQHCPIHTEINELAKENDKLKEQVITDPLTGLFNRRHIFDSLDKECERTLRTGQPTSIALLDLDHFKKINDTYGHPAGDTVLRSLADIIKQNTRRLDISSRYGGEEFCILFPGSFLLTAKTVAERIRECIENTAITIDGKDIHITASIGLACYQKASNITAKQLLEQADKQLYKAKETGRNKVCLPEQDEDKSRVKEEEKDALFNALKDL